MKNSTSEEVFYRLNDFSVKFAYVYSIEYFFCLSIWVILSIFWSVILVSKMYSESKRFKYESRNRCNMDREKWNHLEKNYKLKRTTNMLMILLCIMEIMVSLTVISISGATNKMHSISHRLHIRVITPYSNIMENSFSIQFRLLSSLAIAVMIFMLDIISMITVCFIKCYEFYPSKCKHPVWYGFIRISIKIAVILLLSSVIQLLIFQRFVAIIFLLHEYVRLVRLTQKLCRILHQKYFDARFHENQHYSIVNYYKQIHLQFKIGSIIVLLFFFFSFIVLVIVGLYPIILTLLTNTKWFNLVYRIPVPMDYLVSGYNWTLMSVEQIIIILSGTSLGLGSIIITVPYLLVTLLYIKRNIKKAIKFRNSSFHSDLIEKMINNHNSYYYMNN